MLTLSSVMIGTKQPSMLVTFYEKVLGKPADMVNKESGFWGWQLATIYLSILEHSGMTGNTKDPGRVMFNFETRQVKEEFQRIKGLGGKVIREPSEEMGGSGSRPWQTRMGITSNWLPR